MLKYFETYAFIIIIIIIIIIAATISSPFPFLGDQMRC